jgi:hypothetical protein
VYGHFDIGMPVFHCDVCGSRVPNDRCEKHINFDTRRIALRDRYTAMRVIRNVADAKE